jgi:predicted ribonuclease YlaK
MGPWMVLTTTWKCSAKPNGSGEGRAATNELIRSRISKSMNRGQNLLNKYVIIDEAHKPDAK